MRDKTLIGLAGLTLAALAGAVVVHTVEDSAVERRVAARAPVFDGLMAVVNDVRTIALEGKGGPTTIVRDDRDDAVWRVSERDGYPAAPDMVKTLVVGMAGERLEEQRTALPERYATIGVEEPGGEGAKSVRVTLRDGAKTDLASLIVGEVANGAASGVGPTRLYVRRSGEAQSWLASGSMDPVVAEPARWLDRRLPKLPRDQVTSVAITWPDGAKLSLERSASAPDAPNAKDFVAKGLPEGAAADPAVIERVVGALAYLTLEDVAKPGADWFKGAPTYVFTGKEGGVITARVVKRDDAWWLSLASTGVPDVPDTAPWAYRVLDIVGGDFPATMDAFVQERPKMDAPALDGMPKTDKPIGQ